MFNMIPGNLIAPIITFEVNSAASSRTARGCC